MQTPRQLRRAAAKKEQRRLRKQNGPVTDTAIAAIQDNQFASEVTSLEQSAALPDPISPARQAANQHNAQFSTGPKTPEGKHRSSLNAVRTGLTGKTILLAAGEADAYVELCRRFRRDWIPASGREQELVQMLADTQWRLNRVPSLESGIFAAGRISWHDQIAAEHPNADAATIDSLLECHILATRATELRNLHLQESRLRRAYQATLTELKQLQAERKAETEAEEKAAQLLAAASREPQRAAAAHIGFVFADASHIDVSSPSQNTETPGAHAPHTPPIG